MSKHTLYAWKAKYGGMDVSQAQDAKQLRDERHEAAIGQMRAEDVPSKGSKLAKLLSE